MPQFSSTRRVRHSAAEMFDLVADMERYPEFVPLCTGMRVRGRNQLPDGVEVATASMTIAYKLFHETFTTRVTMNRPELWIKVEYIDGPLRALENRWTFLPQGDNACDVKFFISYEFASRVLALLMGAVFEAAFRRFSAAFEQRADQLYRRPSTS